MMAAAADNEDGDGSKWRGWRRPIASATVRLHC